MLNSLFIINVIFMFLIVLVIYYTLISMEQGQVGRSESKQKQASRSKQEVCTRSDAMYDDDVMYGMMRHTGLTNLITVSQTYHAIRLRVHTS